MSSWTTIKTIAKREFSSYFTSPVAYVFIVIFLGLSGIFTFLLGGFFERQEASLVRPFFDWHPWLFLFLVPAAGMRVWSEERRLGTLELLLTMPVTPWQAIVGKFIASWLFLVIALFLTFPTVLTVSYLGNPDMGAIFTGYIGSVLLAGAYLAVTCMTSAMTRNQVISFILSVVICFGLIAVGWSPVTEFLSGLLPDRLVDVVASFSVLPHFAGFQRGVIDSRDFFFFLSIVGLALFCTGVIIRNIRSGN